MENKSRIGSRISAAVQSISEFLNGQVWFQQLREKWEELDSQTRNAVKLGGFFGVVLVIFLFLLSSIWGVHSLKSELSQKRELLALIQSSTDEMRNLKDITLAASTSAMKASGDWSTYFESILPTAGLDKTNLTVSTEKPGESTEQFKESLMDITLKKINVKQLVRYTYLLENGARPAKVRNLSVHAAEDLSGYLDVVLAVSTFTLIPPKI